jgi:hypothetical protein
VSALIRTEPGTGPLLTDLASYFGFLARRLLGEPQRLVLPIPDLSAAP